MSHNFRHIQRRPHTLSVTFLLAQHMRPMTKLFSTFVVLTISASAVAAARDQLNQFTRGISVLDGQFRSEEHTSELQSLMRISYAVFCLKKKNEQITQHRHAPQRHEHR